MVDTTLGPQNLTETTPDYKDYPEKGLSNIKIFIICIYFAILVMGVIGNGLVIYVTGYKMKTTVNSIWFLNLAIADFIFLFSLVVYVIDAFDKMVGLFTTLMCKCLSFVMTLNMFASIFFLTVISLDRCLCTWMIQWVQNKRTVGKARIICVFVWLLSILCSLPFVISIQKLDRFKYCVYDVSIDGLTFLTIYRFMVGFLIPFLIIASSYIAIGIRVKRLKTGKKRRSFWVIMAVILAFFICWFPFHAQNFCLLRPGMCNWIGSDIKTITAVLVFINCLIYLNSCLNPILYVFMCDKFRKTLKMSLLLVFEAGFAEEHLGFPSAPLVHTPQSHQIPSR